MELGMVLGLISAMALAAWLFRVASDAGDALIMVFNWGTGYKLKHYWHQKLLRKNLKSEYRKILQDYFLYYRRLTDEHKLLFERRLQYFIDTKKFVSRSPDLKLSDEMVVLISACAIQLTFGFPGIYFSHFYRILIYPNDYYSRITRKYHQGEVNRAGIIVLSWSNFLQGYAQRGNGRNLGLHEMAHAMMLENKITNQEYEFLSNDHLDRWYRLAKKEIEQIKKGESIFREYGSTNIHEFFAVAVEVYFEQPLFLYHQNRPLYETMALLLNQDVLEIQQLHTESTLTT